MSYYGELQRRDIVHWLEPLINSKQYKCRRADGKFERDRGLEPHNSPWHHINYSVGAKCPYLQEVFNVISPRTPIGQFVPRRCQECWKIVIRPKTLKQLFALEKLLIELDLPSKCGVEKRSYTPLSQHRYGGYIYNSSYDDGLNNLRELRKILANHAELSEVECYLKRGCTEMEMAKPNSHEWSVSAEQDRIEDLLEWLIVFDIQASMTSKHILDKVHMGWVEWAAENGDETYLEYTGGRPLYSGVVKYELPVEGTNEVTPNGETEVDGLSSQAAPKGTTKRKPRSKK